jgi:hypothetical protein
VQIVCGTPGRIYGTKTSSSLALNARKLEVSRRRSDCRSPEGGNNERVFFSEIFPLSVRMFVDQT